MDHAHSVKIATAWLRGEASLVCARIAYLIREKGVDTRGAVCAKIFPDADDPTGGVVITPQDRVYQFGFNRAGMVAERAVIDEWISITDTHTQHPWRDEILAGLAFREQEKDG